MENQAHNAADEWHVVRGRSKVNYSIGYVHMKNLRRIAFGAREHAAVDRLAEGRGDPYDLCLASAMYDRVHDGENAQELLRILPCSVPTEVEQIREELAAMTLKLLHAQNEREFFRLNWQRALKRAAELGDKVDALSYQLAREAWAS